MVANNKLELDAKHKVRFEVGHFQWVNVCHSSELQGAFCCVVQELVGHKQACGEEFVDGVVVQSEVRVHCSNAINEDKSCGVATLTASNQVVETRNKRQESRSVFFFSVEKSRVVLDSVAFGNKGQELDEMSDVCFGGWHCLLCCGVFF